MSRRLGVSHQAPYKHFQSRDHILAEIVSRAFDAFARHLEARPRHNDAGADLEEMGRAYFAYAHRHPLQYRLMFGTPLPDPESHPEMMLKAQRAFALLKDAVARLPAACGTEADLDALFVWSAIHGLATILQSHAIDTLGLSHATLSAAIPRTLMRLGFALGRQDDPMRTARDALPADPSRKHD